jgi:hypothetical protein
MQNIQNGQFGRQVAGIVLLAGVFTLLGLANPAANSVGLHTFEDALPVIILLAGSILWLTTLIPVQRGATQAQPTSDAA